VERVVEIVPEQQPVGKTTLIEAVSAACLCNTSKATKVVTLAAEKGLNVARQKGRNTTMRYTLAAYEA